MAKRIITEADVLKMAVPAEIFIDRETIVTPSALDAAFSRGVRVIYGKNHGSHSGSGIGAGKQNFNSSFLNLPDGDYIVQIRQGRPRWYQIGNDGVRPRAVD
ncbi:MAG: hypothetical protein KJ645_02570 [Planctomycetes bacterium]|nr:hypothetical protein [Planctomycetota bacterium]